MAYPQHWLLSFGGSLVPGEETWVCGIRMAVYGDTPLGGVDEEQYLTDTAVPALTAWFGRSTSKIGVATTLTTIKFNEIDANGHYADPGNTHVRTVNLTGGGGGTNYHPLQVSVCLTWLTDSATRGPASRGRIYSPRPLVSVDSNGDIAALDRQQMATSAAQLLNSLDASAGLPPAGVLRPSIVSPVGPGYARQIDTVRVDSQCDIQRSRARSASRAVSDVDVVY